MSSDLGISDNADNTRTRSPRNENDTGGGILSFVGDAAAGSSSPLMTLSPSTALGTMEDQFADGAAATFDAGDVHARGGVDRVGEDRIGVVNGAEDRISGSAEGVDSEDDKVITAAYPEIAARSNRYRPAAKECPEIVDPLDPRFDPSAFDSCDSYTEAID